MGRPEPHDTCETTQGIHLLACGNRSHRYPDCKVQAPASEYRVPLTPVPDRVVPTVLYSTLPFAELAGGQDLHTGPLGTIGLPLPIISRYVDSTFKTCHSATILFDLTA